MEDGCVWDVEWNLGIVTHHVEDVKGKRLNNGRPLGWVGRGEEMSEVEEVMEDHDCQPYIIRVSVDGWYQCSYCGSRYSEIQ